MKKLFSAFTAVLLAFCFISCAPQELSDRSSKNEGSVSLSIRSPRTISPAEGISYKDVQTWTVTFKDRTAQYDDIIVKDVNFNATPSKEIRLPIGTYNVTLNGTANNPTSGETVHFYGEASVTVVGGTTVPISVFVAPKKSEGGTGSFNFTVATSGFGNYPPDSSDSSDSSSFIVSLTPFGDEIPVATWTPTVARKFENNVEIYSFSVSSATLESQSVPSGFYTLSIKYTWDVYVEGIPLTKTKEIYYPNHDFLVEIIDGLTTTGSADIIVSTEESKTYYATTGTSIGNGAFKSMPKNLDELLVDINRTTISEANIYMVDSLDIDTLTITYPEIDVSKVNATGKTYKIYTKGDTGIYNEKPCYTITGAAVKGDEPTIYIDSSVRTVTLKNSQSSSGISGRAKIVALEKPEFVLKDNTSVFIDLTDVQRAITETTICMPDSTYNSYYAEHPCVTCVTDKDNPNFQVFLERLLSTSYSVVTKSSDDGIYKTTNFYIIPSYKAGLSVEGIPKYSLVATTKYGESVTDDTPLYAGDTVTVTATPEQGSFAEGTTFAWFINGEQRDCTKNSYEITFGDNAVANNTIICLAEYKGRYATAGIDLNNIRDMTTLLYNNYNTTYRLAYSILGADTFDSSYILSNSEFSEDYDSFPDFCIDAYNNVYSIFKGKNGRYKISKASSSEEYLDRTDYSYNGNGTLSLIKMGNDGKLYVVDSNNQFGIVTLSADAASGNSASVNLLTNPSDFGSSSEEILSFCVDSQGFIYVTYKVVSNGSTNIILSKFTNTGNVLSMDSSQSKTLFEITDTTITVSSGYFDLPNYIYSNITITDMHCEGDYIYLIMRDVMDSGSPSEFHSLGGVCTISTDLSLPTEKKQFVGWASDIVNTTGDGETAIYTYKHDEYFYGPQKIIAIKPKEIILADDGVYIENNVKLNKNRVVVFNLFDNSISKSYDAPADIDFECSTSGPYNGQ